MIEAFCNGLEFLSREQLVAQLESGSIEIWRLSSRGWALLEFLDTKYGKTMNILTIVGGQAQWQRGVAALETIAKEQGCKLIYSVGYPGWIRLLRKHGWQTRLMMRMTKEIAQ